MPRKKTPNLSSWLSKLDRESWNPELVISGFSIFLLFQANKGVGEVFSLALFDAIGFENSLIIWELSYVSTILHLAIRILLVNLLIHIFLRGFWIGCVGLRSVKRHFHFSQLSYSPFFTEKLNKRSMNLDELIIRLDRACSTIFSFTYLVMFMLISFGFWLIIISFMASVGIGIGYRSAENPSLLLPFLLLVLLGGLFILGSIIYFLDTLTLGFFKRHAFLSKLYYPIYWFYSGLFFSWIYRPLYYALVGRGYKNWLRFFLIIYLFIPFGSGFFWYDGHVFFDDSKSYEVQNKYDDQRFEEVPVFYASIPSEVVTERFLPLFIKYNPRELDESLEEECSYIPLERKGLNDIVSMYLVNFGDYPDIEDLLSCLPSVFNVELNGMEVDSLRFQLHKNEQGTRGFRTIIDLGGCEPGYNVLKANYAEIPFYLDK